MAKTTPATRLIEVFDTHWAAVTPFDPALYAALGELVVQFDAAGPCGHDARPAVSHLVTPAVDDPRRTVVTAAGGVERANAQLLPLGRVDEARDWLAGRGHVVEVRDHRTDSPRWVLALAWRSTTPRELWPVLSAVHTERALRVVAGSLDVVADVVAAASVAYPDARIAVAVPTNRLLWSFRRRLQAKMPGVPVGYRTARRKRPGRVAVGLVRQFPMRERGEYDLLVLPVAEATVGDEALRVVTSGGSRRVLSFSPRRRTGDTLLDQRLMVVAGSVYPPEEARATVTAVFLDTHGTRPAGQFADPLDAKRRLYWHNKRRNDRIAEVARRLLKRTVRAVRTLVTDAALVAEVVEAAKAGVAVLVETPAHARELAGRLPGWAVWTAWSPDDPIRPRPAPGSGVIVTELAAAEIALHAGILVRATGTRWPLPDVGWPWVRTTDHGVLIDFHDDYHPAAAKSATAREAEYRRADMAVWVTRTTAVASGQSAG